MFIRNSRVRNNKLEMHHAALYLENTFTALNSGQNLFLISIAYCSCVNVWTYFCGCRFL